MAARRVTYADLDALLTRLGLTRRLVQIPDPIDTATDDDSSRDAAGTTPPRTRPAVVYQDAATDTLIILPPRPLDEPAQPQHVFPTRRHLVEKGLIKEVDFERWVCGMRFGEVCRDESASNGTQTVTRVRGRRSRTG